jgi:hypothetical protein
VLGVGVASAVDGTDGQAGHVDRARRVGLGDLVFAVALLGTMWWYLRLSRGFFFLFDDWIVAARPGTVADLIQPHNGHLSVLPLLVYRGLYGMFGLESYLPQRVLGVATLAALVIGLYVFARHRLGFPPALVLSMSVLWMHVIALTPFLFNFHVALLCGVLSAAALPSRSARADLVVGSSLVVALCTSSVGAAVAAACVAHSLLDGFRRRRWLAVMLPTAGWFGWWVVHRDDPAVTATFGEKFGTVARGIARSFAAPVGGSLALGAIIVVACAVLLAWRWAKDRPSARTQLAWMAALPVWWTGVAWSRPDAAGTGRYAYVGAVFVLLSVVPAHRIERLHGSSLRLRTVVPAAAVVLAMVVVNHGDIRQAAVSRTTNSDVAMNVLVELEWSAPPVSDSVRMGRRLGGVTVGQYRSIVERLGPPPGPPGDPDELLVQRRALRVVAVTALPAGAAGGCSGGSTATLGIGASITLVTGESPVPIVVRRYGPTFVSLGTVGPGRMATMETSGDSVDATPWQVRAPGGCLRTP